MIKLSNTGRRKALSPNNNHVHLQSKISSECFKEIKGTNGKYFISTLGRVRSFSRKGGQRGFDLRTYIRGKDYVAVNLYINGKVNNLDIHRLIALHFIPLERGRNCVNHKNLTKTDNSISNLEWCTPKENVEHAKKHGRYKLKRSSHTRSHVK